MIEKIINLFDTIHQKRIIKYISKFNLKNIIDVGAHKGEFLSYCLDLKKLTKIYSFEPQKKIFLILKKKYKNNKKIELHNIAFSSKSIKKKFYINKLSSTSTFSELNKKSYFQKIKKFLLFKKNLVEDTFFIKTRKLDFFFKNKKLTKTLLKIDTEGHEYHVLSGSKKKLSEIDFILLENHFFKIYNHDDKKKIAKIMKEKNFTIIKKFNFPLPYFQDVLFKNKNVDQINKQ